MDAISSGFYGMMAASNQLDTTAASLAKGTVDPVTAVIGAAEDKTAFQANAAVVKTADSMIGALLDIKV
jgi:flagellar hook protein FlgE